MPRRSLRALRAPREGSGRASPPRPHLIGTSGLRDRRPTRPDDHRRGTGQGSASRPPTTSPLVPVASAPGPGSRGDHTFERDGRRRACRPPGPQHKITKVVRVTATTAYSAPSPTSHPGEPAPAQEAVNYTGVIRRSVT